MYLISVIAIKHYNKQYFTVNRKYNKMNIKSHRTQRTAPAIFSSLLYRDPLT
jgi:hypothetical protein